MKHKTAFLYLQPGIILQSGGGEIAILTQLKSISLLLIFILLEILQ